MTTTSVNIADMHCTTCSNKITNALNQNEYIHNVSVNPIHRRIFVTHDPQLSAVDIVHDIEQLGFQPRLADVYSPDQDIDRELLRRLGVAGICTMQVMMIQIALYAGFFQGMDAGIHRLLTFAALVFTIPVFAYAAVPFFVNGFAWVIPDALLPDAKRRSINMDTPIALAIAIAFGVSLTSTLTGEGEVYFDSVTMFTFLMLGARYLDQRLRQKLQVEASLTETLPQFATRVIDSVHTKVGVSDLKVGDALWIGEGEHLPVDGFLESDRADINSALLSGESRPQQHRRGDRLFAGTINEGGAFTLRVSQVADATRISAIHRIAADASFDKHGLSRVADSVARVFVPCILLIATATYIYWMWLGTSQGSGTALTAALAVLVVSCPCALSLAAPAAISAALTKLRRKGLLVRHSRAVERAGNVKAVHFDKTGTLTRPHAQLVATHPVSAWNEDAVKDIAAALEHHSSHPLAYPFKIQDPLLSVSEVQIERSGGVRGLVDGQPCAIGSAAFCGIEPPERAAKIDGIVIYLSVDERLAAYFVLDSVLRDDARDTVDGLTQRGLQVEIASGDGERHCRTIAAELGVDFTHGLTPETKCAAVKATDGVMFVGDGINDLPALAAADVSVSTLETIDLVKSRADVLMMSGHLSGLNDLIDVSRQTRRVMRQNMLWAVAYNVVAIPLAVIGLATPWLAALGMSLSSILVMLNACRLLKN